MIIMAGFFDKIFDFNQDGKLNTFERATQFATFASIMDDEERREAIEDAGLDPDDYDFD